MKEVRLNLQHLIEQKERRDKVERITQEDIEKATNIPQGTLSRLINNRVDTYNRRYLTALMNYFQCEVGDLFEIVYEFETD